MEDKGEEEMNKKKSLLTKQQGLPKYKERYYRAIILICKFHSGGHANVVLSIFPTLIVYLFMFYGIPLMLGYDPLQVPAILRILVLAICLIFFFFIGEVIDRSRSHIQKHFEYKLNQSIKR